jgi:hypothetical protein
MSTTSAIIDPTNTTVPYGYAYAGGSCSPTIITGINDGISGSNYLFSTTSNTISIPTASVLQNDIPTSGLNISGLSIVYNNATINASVSISGGNIIVSATPGSGLILLSYIPVNASNQYGNLTYIFVYFASSSCNPANYCNLIQNGDFENVIGGTFCGPMTGTNAVNIACWARQQGTPVVITRSCTTGFIYDLAQNTIGSSPPVNSFSGIGNDKIVGLHLSYDGFNSKQADVIVNNLSTPLVPSNTYSFSFIAHNPTNAIPGNNTSASPVVITIASAAQYPSIANNSFPGGVNVIADFTLPCTPTWTQISQGFTFTAQGNIPHQAFLIGINSISTIAQNSLSFTSPATNVWCYLDDIQLLNAPSPSVAFTQTLCGNQTMSNLGQYASISGGIFSGDAVTLLGGQYNFNANPPLQPGLYPVAYTYTSGGCTNTINTLITISTKYKHCLERFCIFTIWENQ